jgi:hypothetical protein
VRRRFLGESEKAREKRRFRIGRTVLGNLQRAEMKRPFPEGRTVPKGSKHGMRKWLHSWLQDNRNNELHNRRQMAPEPKIDLQTKIYFQTPPRKTKYGISVNQFCPLIRRTALGGSRCGAAPKSLLQKDCELHKERYSQLCCTSGIIWLYRRLSTGKLRKVLQLRGNRAFCRSCAMNSGCREDCQMLKNRPNFTPKLL